MRVKKLQPTSGKSIDVVEKVYLGANVSVSLKQEGKKVHLAKLAIGNPYIFTSWLLDRGNVDKYGTAVDKLYIEG